MRRKWTSQKGASAVEFALLLPFLMVILWGIIEFSLLMYNQQMITNASREGARAGIVAQNPRFSNAEITQVVKDYCEDYVRSFGGTGLSVTTDPPNPETASPVFGDELKVTVFYDYRFLAFQRIEGIFLKGSWGNKILKAESVMRYE